MKQFRIEITNNRNSKVLGGGLPSFSRNESFATLEEAAKAIFEGAYELIDSDVTEHIPCFDDDDDNEKFNAVWEQKMAEARADIVKYEGWSYDGVQYHIKCYEYGQLFTGTPDGDHLINLEPVGGVLDDIDLFPVDEAKMNLREHLDGFANEYDIVDEPWGWTVCWTDDDGNEQESHFCWKS